MTTSNKSFLVFLALSLIQTNQGFESTMLSFSNSTVQTAVDIFVSFVLTWDMQPGELVKVKLPRFTRRVTFGYDYKGDTYSALNIPMGSVVVAPSEYFVGGWVEGSYTYSADLTSRNSTPYYASEFHLMMKSGLQFPIGTHLTQVPAGTNISIVIMAENGIGAMCGFPSSDYLEDFQFYDHKVLPPILTGGFYLTSNHSFNIDQPNATYPILTYGGIGEGCDDPNLNDCSGHGACDFCYQQCQCFDGYGSLDDIVMAGHDVAMDCSESEMKICNRCCQILDAKF